MKKVVYTFSAIVMMALNLTSCQKDEKVITHFTASLEQNDGQEGKLYLEDHMLKWNGGEELLVINTNGNSATFTVTPNPNNATIAHLTNSTGIDEAASYTAIYPASIGTTSTASVVLPDVQNTLDGSLVEFPMYAQSSSTNFQFKNLCGAVRIRLQQSGVSIKKIVVRANNICGSFPIQTNSEEPCVYATLCHTTGDKTVQLNCQNAQSIDEQHDFYIYLPVGTYNTMELKIHNDHGDICTKTGSNVTIQRSKISTINCGLLEFVQSTSQATLPGLFSVSSTKQVRFSKGNLQYQASTSTWRFAENQYDCVGLGNANISSSYSGWIDLFGWSTSATNFGVSISTNNNDYSGYFRDWGQNIISGNTANSFRTLTKDEWTYLRYSRPYAANKCGVGRIQMTDGNYANGCIFLPDNWTSPSGCSFIIAPSNMQNDYTINTYSRTQWMAMEQAGALFLPATGYRVGQSVLYLSLGRYWSASLYNDNFAFGIYFGSNGVEPYGSRDRSDGQSVRLVQDNINMN